MTNRYHLFGTFHVAYDMRVQHIERFHENQQLSGAFSLFHHHERIFLPSQNQGHKLFEVHSSRDDQLCNYRA